MKHTQLRSKVAFLIPFALSSCMLADSEPSGGREAMGQAAEPGCGGCDESDYTDEGYIETDLGKLWYGVFGEGVNPPVLLVNGTGISHHALIVFARNLAAQGERRVVIFDSIGVGFSDPLPAGEKFSVEQRVAEISTIINELELPRYHLWGFSLGGLFALRHAAQKPEMLMSTSLNGPMLDVPMWNEHTGNLIAAIRETTGNLDEALGQDEYNLLFARHLLFGLGGEMYPCFQEALQLGQTRDEPHKFFLGDQPGEGLTNVGGDLATLQDAHLIEEIERPTWVVCGEQDFLPPDLCEKFAAYSRWAAHQYFPRTSHISFMEDEQGYMHRYLAFIQCAETAEDPLTCVSSDDALPAPSFINGGTTSRVIMQ